MSLNSRVAKEKYLRDKGFEQGFIDKLKNKVPMLLEDNNRHNLKKGGNNRTDRDNSNDMLQ